MPGIGVGVGIQFGSAKGLNWTTLTNGTVTIRKRVTNGYFVVEKTTDGVTWEVLQGEEM